MVNANLEDVPDEVAYYIMAYTLAYLCHVLEDGHYSELKQWQLNGTKASTPRPI